MRASIGGISTSYCPNKGRIGVNEVVTNIPHNISNYPKRLVEHNVAGVPPICDNLDDFPKAFNVNRALWDCYWSPLILSETPGSLSTYLVVTSNSSKFPIRCVSCEALLIIQSTRTTRLVWYEMFVIIIGSRLFTAELNKASPGQDWNYF